MKKLPDYIEQKFFDIISGKIDLGEFESWVYADKEIESVLSDDVYITLISFNYKKNGAKYELLNLVSSRIIDIGEYEKLRILNLLYTAQQGDEKLPEMLRQFYDLYCRGYDFLRDLGLGYGLAIAVPPSNYRAEIWEEMSESDRTKLLQSFYPQIRADIQRAINWVENIKIVFKGTTDENGHYEYDDLRTGEEMKSTVWTAVENDRDEESK